MRACPIQLFYHPSTQRLAEYQLKPLLVHPLTFLPSGIPLLHFIFPTFHLPPPPLQKPAGVKKADALTNTFEGGNR